VAASVLIGALALLLLAPGGALAAKKKLSVKVASSSQTQVSNQGALKVSFKAKGLSKVSASATATPDGGSPGDFAAKASKNNPKQGTLSLPLTADGQAALDDCASLSIKVKASGSGKKANASAVLAEDDPECAKPVKEFATQASVTYPTGIDVGPDGNLWFAQMGSGNTTLGKMTPDGLITNIPIPVPAAATPSTGYNHLINDVVAGPDGDIWASPENGGGGPSSFARRIDPATNDVTEYDIGGTADVGSKIAVGPDGDIWMGSPSTTSLIRIDPDTGDVTPFPLSDPAFPDISPKPYGLAAGGDGAVWFTTPDVNSGGGAGMTAAIGRLDPATGETQLFPLSDPTKLMGYMTADVAGRLWFTTPTGNTIGRIDPSSGQIVEFQIPTPDSHPIGITFASDGSLWFTEASSDNIGRYDPASGQFTEYPLDTLGSVPFDIVQGEDGMIYFTETGIGKIGKLDPNKAPAGSPNPSDGLYQYPFAHRCPPGSFICQQQANLEGSTFKIGDALTQQLPPQTLTLTGGIVGIGPMIPPTSGPMLEAKPLDVVVGGTPATTSIGLAGPVDLSSIIPIAVQVPIDLFVSQPGNPAGGCVIGPVVQNLASVPDDEGDPGAFLAGDSALADNSLEFTLVGTGTLSDTTFTVPEARGCGALTDIINNLLALPSEANNETRLPFSQSLLLGGF
jgi:virginiamycin B lyase